MVVASGLTPVLPSAGSPLPASLSIATLVAFVAVHAKLDEPPTPMIAGAVVKLLIVGRGGTVMYSLLVSVAEPPGPPAVEQALGLPPLPLSLWAAVSPWVAVGSAQ